jgi:hypothetical protein
MRPWRQPGPIPHASRLTCQTPRMRPVNAILGYLVWRVSLARMGFLVRLRSMISSGVVFGGIGAAIGYMVVGRLLGASDDDETETRRDPE